IHGGRGLAGHAERTDHAGACGIGTARDGGSRQMDANLYQWDPDTVRPGRRAILDLRMPTNEARDDVTIREAQPEDASVCGQICYDAFHTVNERHGFPCDFPGPERATAVLSMMFSHPGFYCVVAEAEGRVAGSN